MLKLEPLIEKLVDDLFKCIREAGLEGVRKALATETGNRRSASVRSQKAVRRGEDRTRPRRVVRKPARPTALTNPIEIPEPPAAAAITNPEALLAGLPSTPERISRTATSDSETARSAPESESPPSEARPVVIPLSVRLREGESVLRASEAGVILRRARSA